MGEGASKFDEPLMPQATPLWVVDQKYCQSEQLTLHLREKFWSLSGDDFQIRDANTGVVWFKCSGKTFSLREKKVVMDNTGNPVLNIRESILHLAPDFHVYTGDTNDKELFKLDSHLTLLKAKAETTFTNGGNGHSVTLVCKGNWRTKEACIYIGEPKVDGVPIAKIFRPTTARGLAFDIQDYHVTIAENVDVAMVVALCLCLDECKKD